MTSLILTEAQLLSQLPISSRVVSPSHKVFIKHPDGVWWNWANGACTGLRLQPAHDIPAGSQAYLPNELVLSCYVKHPNGNWLSVRPPSEAFAPNNAAGGHPAGQPGPGPSAAPLQILPQNTYRSGAAPVDDSVVLFNAPMSAAARGQVADATGRAFTGELAVQEKASIRFGLQYVESSGYRPRQHNLQRYGAPIMRGQLAMAIAEEVGLVLDALAAIGRPLTLPSGRRVAFDDLFLVDIRRVSRGSLQPTLAVRGA
ncbi:hypothetical protein LXA43DRAFT_1097429 [Ganoderma leucocontextum]|nr:hypothetical protein LXA43DRAFT_1097429 [Ganoderma leucocontextum]